MKSMYNDAYIEIISKLRAIRIARMLTQQDMASLLGVNQSFISKVENRERRLDIIEFLNWIDVLEVSINDVIPQVKI